MLLQQPVNSITRECMFARRDRKFLVNENHVNSRNPDGRTNERRPVDLEGRLHRSKTTKPVFWADESAFHNGRVRLDSVS